MLRRPRVNETDDDLLCQQEELMARGALQPSAKIVKLHKRKTEDSASQKPPDDEAPTKCRSKFAQDRDAKKRKEGIVDNTVLMEATSRKEKVAVLGNIIERTVPANISLLEWKPSPTPTGFPKVHRLHNLTSTRSSVPGAEKKSLYMQHLESEGLLTRTVNTGSSCAASSESPSFLSNTSQDPAVSALGNHSFAISGEGILHKSDIEKIHQESLARIASLSHEERIKEQQELLSQLSPEQITFLRSLRTRRDKTKTVSTPRQDDTTTHDGMITKSTSMEVEDSNSNDKDDLPHFSSFKPSIVPVHDESSSGQDNYKVTFSDDVEMLNLHDDDDEPVPDSQLPIPPSQAHKWLHMDKVEMEKLKYFTDLPKPKPLKNNEGFIARFNFKGDILPYDADISHLEGLHKHGKEPGRAGYSMDELFILIRSKVLAQRQLGLRTLGNILRNAKEGFYDTCVNPPIMQLVVEAGAVLLLRFALDDSSHLVFGEAVRGLYYLIASEPDEQCLVMAQPWVPAGLEPGIASNIHASEKARQELDQEEAELKDFEIIKLDVIRALVRMDTHIRLRYILESLQPSPETVINILGILTRMVRHSLTAAWTLAQTPHLISVILDHFLPHNLSPLLTGQSVASMSSVYGVPLREALHLLKIMAAKGRQLAAILVNTHDVVSRILVYVSLEPSEISIPLKEALALSQEAYSLWGVLLTYGLSKPQEAFISFYPMLVRKLVFYRDKVSVSDYNDTNKFNYDVGAHMIAVMMRALNIAATHSLLKNKMMLNQGTTIGADGKAEVLVPPELTWNDLQDLPQLVETCLTKWLTELARISESTFSALRLIGSCCDFLEAYYVKWKDQTSYSGEVFNTRIKHLYNIIISTVLNSSMFRNLISVLPSHSSLISDLVPGTERDPNNLGSLGCVTFGGKVIPLGLSSSPFPLLLPLSNLLLSLHTLHPALDSQSVCAVLDSDEIATYLEKLCQSSQQLSSQWLTRIETHFICNILQVAALKGCRRRKLYHETALFMMPCIHKGDEHLIKTLLTCIICAPEFTSDLAEMSTCVRDLALQDYEPLKSPAIAQPVLSPLQLTNSICHSIKSIESELVNSLVSRREYDASLVLKNGIPFIINSITISQIEFPLVLDQYWPLYPIKCVFKISQQPPQPQDKTKQEQLRDQSSPEDILTVTRCLQLTYLTLKHRRNTTIHTTTLTGWMYHLSLVFLAANDIFLDANINSYLQGCLVEVFRNGGYANLDTNSKFEGYSALIDWYRNMVEQFMSVSYGDSTFALFLTIPLQQYWPVDFRKLLWGDNNVALQFFRLTTEQVDQFIPVQQFLEPAEQDEGMIIKYRSALGCHEVTVKRNPFLYKVAAHHAHI
ncbi:hypothetical protein OTU49_007805 [Cherax quadricarinatus]|uniref:RNA polymerase II-associated protein 1 n=1 Tax=Cherax quadricarinatus TaxID=27406 RepID=A0AAW0WGC1_CHEQU